MIFMHSMALFTGAILFLAKAFFASLFSSLSMIFLKSYHFSPPFTGMTGNLISITEKRNNI